MPTTATLSSYRTDLQRYLRDETAQIYSTGDLNSFINRAMQQRDLDLGINRSRIQFTLTASTFDYTFATVLGGTVLDGPASPNVTDVVSIIILPLGSPGVRYPLARWPYSRLAYLLSTSYPTYPVAYALYGPTTVMLAPPPAGAYVSEWDFAGYASPLVNDGDLDPLPYPWTDPVPFLAAHFAKIQTQRFDEADAFFRLYQQHLNMVRARSRPFAVVRPWSDLPKGAR